MFRMDVGWDSCGGEGKKEGLEEPRSRGGGWLSNAQPVEKPDQVIPLFSNP